MVTESFAKNVVTGRALPLSIEQAIERLRHGGLVAIPTETVYGLAADAAQPCAVRRIFAVKRRPADHPLIVHIGSVDQVQEWARDVPDILGPLADRFWPGPLTVVLNRQAHVDTVVTGGQTTVALRVPAHPTALRILMRSGLGLAAPSANRFGRVSPTQPRHVIDEFGHDIDGIVDGGVCSVGIESTILDLSGRQPSILRPGRISQPEIERCLGIDLSDVSRKSPRAPGRLKAHYAPETPLVLLDRTILVVRTKEYLERGLTINVWSVSRPEIEHRNLFWRQQPVDSDECARELYRQLREFDRISSDITLIERPPELPEWRGVLDRLARAAAHFSFPSPSLHTRK